MAKGIWKQDPEEKIWGQGEYKWEMENTPQLGTSEFVTFTWYSQIDEVLKIKMDRLCSQNERR